MDARLSKGRPPILHVRGFPYPGHELYTTEKIESALDYVPQEGDIFIVTYPKSGTTWLTYIVWEILNSGRPLPSMEEINYRLIPYMEMCGASIIQNQPRPKAFKYHSNYQLIPKHSSAKYIYLYRNPKDTCVSRFFFTQEIYGTAMDFDRFVEMFLCGKLAHGSWFEHIASWYESKEVENIMLLSYEELLEDTRASVLKLSYFIGESYGKLLDEDGDLMDTILKQTSFEYMKANLSVLVPTPGKAGQLRKINFFRKGVRGDWKNYFSPRQNVTFDDTIRQKLGHTDLVHMFVGN